MRNKTFKIWEIASKAIRLNNCKILKLLENQIQKKFFSKEYLQIPTTKTPSKLSLILPRASNKRGDI